MSMLYHICIGLSIGVVLGFVIGGIKTLLHRSSYSDQKAESIRRLTNKIATILKYFTFLLLLLGLIWCVYFLIMGIMIPEQSDYANNMAELVATVLTIISILFAFVEFVRPKGDKM